MMLLHALCRRRARRVAIAAAALPAAALAVDAPAPAVAQSFASEAPETAIVEYVLVDGIGAPDPLTRRPGRPERGEAIFADPDRGGCTGCHALDGPADETQIGPSLGEVGGRLSSSALRLWIVNPRFFNPETAMPAYYSLYDGDRPEPSRARPLLSAQDVEDLVAYLDSLKPLGATMTHDGN